MIGSGDSEESMKSYLFLLIAAIGSTVGAQAGVLLSENFDELTPSLSVTSAGAFTAIDGTNVDIVGGGLYGNLCAAPESGNCVDMDGSNGNPQGVLQSASFSLTPGTDYFLSFDLTGSQRGNTSSVTVAFGSYNHTFTLASGDDSTGIVSNALITVSAPIGSTLTFTSNTPGYDGSMLDNVTITSTPVTASAPEPGGAMLIGLPLLALATWLSRKRRLA